jgi:hypothetical protein
MSQILLHIGFGKSGSTYLQQWFEKHPAMYFQPKHIAGGFYHSWELAKYIQYNDQAPQNFVLSCEDLLVWQGEPYVFGLRGTRPYDHRKFQDQMCEALHGLFPTAKILIITRGYTTVYKSIYNQYLPTGGTLTFKELLLNMRDMFTIMFDYTYVVNLYRQKFGAGNIILLPFELLKNDHVKFLSLIEQQMKIEQTFAFLPDKVNAGYPIRILQAHFKLSKLVHKLLLPLPYSWRDRIYIRYSKMLRSIQPHPLTVFISKFIKEQPINWDGMDELLDELKGKAEILRAEELYQPYLKEYLL